MKNETMNSIELCFIIIFTIIGLGSLLDLGVGRYPHQPMETGAVFAGICFVFVAFLIVSYIVRNL
jgi:hypothetical protein